MEDTVLLVVDVQNALIREHPYNENKLIQNIKRVISCCRSRGVEIVYVRHDDGPGGDLARETEGWQICGEVAPEKGDRVFEKHYNSAFFHTGLKEYLDGKKITTVILAGMQTEYCIDATCKAAFEHGYHVIIPQETNSTFDNDYLSGEKLYEFYNYKIWNNRFAKVVPIEALEK